MVVRLKLMCSVILLSLSSEICGRSDYQRPNPRNSDYDDTTIVLMPMVDSGKDSEVDSSNNIKIIHNYYPPLETYEPEEFDDEEPEYNQNELSETKIDSFIQSNDRVEQWLSTLDTKVRSLEGLGLEIMKQLKSINQYITNPCNFQNKEPVLLDPHQMCVIEKLFAAIGEEKEVLANSRNCLGSLDGMVNEYATQKCDTCNGMSNDNRRCNNHRGGCNNNISPKELTRNYRDVKQDKRNVTYEPKKQHCHQLETRRDGIYEFGSLNEVGNEAGRFFHEQYCEFDEAGNAWTVIQRRFVSDHKENFNRSWAEYKHGFGELDKEFWFGNDFIHKLTWDEDMELVIVLEDYIGRQEHVEYSTFQIANEDLNYNLIIEGHRGTNRHNFLENDQDFSTYDRSNDNNGNLSCAKVMGMGWWFKNCTRDYMDIHLGSMKMMVRPKRLQSAQSNDTDEKFSLQQILEHIHCVYCMFNTHNNL